MSATIEVVAARYLNDKLTADNMPLFRRYCECLSPIKGIHFEDAFTRAAILTYTSLQDNTAQSVILAMHNSRSGE